jgi:penicillin V acylase-like amidase (Ntn superfamily)
MLRLNRSLRAAALFLTVAPLASACTRVVYQGPNDDIIAARSMDRLVRCR